MERCLLVAEEPNFYLTYILAVRLGVVKRVGHDERVSVHEADGNRVSGVGLGEGDDGEGFGERAPAKIGPVPSS